MNIASIMGTVAQAVAQAIPVTSGSTTTGQVATSSSTDSTSVSPSGSTLNKLQQLLASNPGQFEQVMTSVAAKLTTAAKATADPQAQQELDALASKFQAAAVSGTLSSLQPASASGGGTSSGSSSVGSPPPAGGASGGASTSSKVHDPADTNYDGKVSAQEALAYAAKQAEAARQQQASALDGASKVVDAELAAPPT